MSQYHVYALVKRGEFHPFYIGCTTDPQSRQSAHRRRFRDDVFDLIVMATFPTSLEAGKVETETIEFYRRRDVSLCNAYSTASYNPARYDLAKRRLSPVPK